MPIKRENSFPYVGAYIVPDHEKTGALHYPFPKQNIMLIKSWERIKPVVLKIGLASN